MHGEQSYSFFFSMFFNYFRSLFKKKDYFLAGHVTACHDQFIFQVYFNKHHGINTMNGIMISILQNSSQRS